MYGIIIVNKKVCSFQTKIRKNYFAILNPLWNIVEKNAVLSII